MSVRRRLQTTYLPLTCLHDSLCAPQTFHASSDLGLRGDCSTGECVLYDRSSSLLLCACSLAPPERDFPVSRVAGPRLSPLTRRASSFDSSVVAADPRLCRPAHPRLCPRRWLSPGSTLRDTGTRSERWRERSQRSSNLPLPESPTSGPPTLLVAFSVVCGPQGPIRPRSAV